MTEKEMTTSEAIIILDRLNTEERIEVDRDELRAAVKLAKDAMRKQVPCKLEHNTFCYESLCSVCGSPHWAKAEFCRDCGQALDWSGT